MKQNYPFKKGLICLVVIASLLSTSLTTQAQRVKKVVFQAFWWDYWNENYRFGWANYLTELAPRLKAAGFNAVWIPPAYKNESPDFVGYMPFDNYDLGDKRQKGNGHPMNDRMRTRVGSKDDLLRMIAVMHANGIEVIHDIVLNHNGGAGGGVLTHGALGAAGQAGAGGQDPAPNSVPTANGFKNFRYVSYSTPALDETQADYWTRNGRWSKNAANFYNCTSNCNDINSMFWGPDINYESGGFGQSSNVPTSGSTVINGNVRAFFNPVQNSNYMLNSSRDWIVWLKKQTGADGFRWDAVKHFPYGGGSVPNVNVQENLIFATKYNAGFANGGQDMLNIGEWVGSAGDLDNYVWNIRTGSAPGGVTNEINTGTFDFNLRGFNSGDGGVFGMITGGGGFNMASLPGRQQSQRVMTYPGGKIVHRTVPFINNHDTYRPILSPNGNFSQPLGNSSGWNNGSQLATNVDPREPRLAAGYAVIFAVDGNPQVFYEDLLNNWSTGMRYNHVPTSTTDLPMNADIQNIMQCHQRLDFKEGNYAVPSASNSPFFQNGSASDHIVFERTGKALIGVTDVFNTTSNNSFDQVVFVTVSNDWPVGTVLYDYSGAHGITTTTVPADRRVRVATAPAGHTIPNAFGRGYSIWAPGPPGVTVTSVQDLYNYLATYEQPLARTTTQEWELADDLGDSHCESLGQGGSLPANSTNQRVAGKIFVQAGTAISYLAYPEIANSNITVSLWDLNGNNLHQIQGTANTNTPITGSFTPTFSGWVTIKARQTVATQATQKCWINVTYQAPAVVDTRATNNAVATRAAIWTGNRGNNSVSDCGNWEEGRIPTTTTDVVIPANAMVMPNFAASQTIRGLRVEQGATLTLPTGVVLTVTGDVSGAGVVNGIVRIGGSTPINITGNISIAQLEMNNITGATLQANITVTSQLIFNAGRIQTTNNTITLAQGATAVSNAATSYLQTANQVNATGGLVQQVGGTAVLFPVGNSNYSPVTLTNSGTATNFTVRSFEQVLADGTAGAAINTNQKVNKTWSIVPTNTNGLNVSATFSWSGADEDAGFNRNSAAVARNSGGGFNNWIRVSNNTMATGSNPYSITANGLSNFVVFGVFSDAAVLPVNWLNFTGVSRGRVNLLQWRTGNEVNNRGFHVQRSLDGINFTDVAFVAAAGTANGNYTFTDDFQNRKIYYRLQQVDNDGRFSFSTIIIVEQKGNGGLISITPNPVTDAVFINADGVNNTENVSVLVYNTQGTLLASQQGSVPTIAARLKYVLQNQPAGVYHFIVNNDATTQRLKVIKK